MECLEREIIELRNILANKEMQLLKLKEQKITKPPQETEYCPKEFSCIEIQRYSRQMMVQDIGVEGQQKLKKSHILIIGIGGLGCPAALYLAAAGVGSITIVDYDSVELTNLHRQILHSENDIGQLKVVSACSKLSKLNSEIEIVPISELGDTKSMQKIISRYNYDVMLDCTDNVATRYLINDIAVQNNIPLVSGSALRMDGQITVYNYNGGPCYRCLFPEPPPPEAVGNCGDEGVLGPVPGVIGTLQALEAIKIVLNMNGVLSGRLLLFDGTETNFRNVKLRTKKSDCKACGTHPDIISINYEQFCSSTFHDKVVDVNLVEEGVNVSAKILSNPCTEMSVILDVRPKTEFGFCCVPNSINMPYLDFLNDIYVEDMQEIINKNKNVYVLCRRGNDSQRAILYLRARFPNYSNKLFNITGGLYAYHHLVDPTFPIY